MNEWYGLPDKWPEHAQRVWVRRTYWFSRPFPATFYVPNQIFTTDDGYSIPWYEVARWSEIS